MSNRMLRPGNWLYRFLKRAFDIICSVALIIPVGLVIGVCSIIIKIEDHGPVFYISDRIGRYGKIFKMFKLRSMKVNSPDIRLPDGTTYNSAEDIRVTRFGRFARKMSIDELPQILNILKGDMSFVGPRPDTPIGAAAYTAEEKIILTVRPGITGYNQATNRNSVLTKEKLKNDIYYVEHLSLLFDIKIIFMTIVAVLRCENVNRSDAEEENANVPDIDAVVPSIGIKQISK